MLAFCYRTLLLRDLLEIDIVTGGYIGHWRSHARQRAVQRDCCERTRNGRAGGESEDVVDVCHFDWCLDECSFTPASIANLYLRYPEKFINGIPRTRIPRLTNSGKIGQRHSADNIQGVEIRVVGFRDISAYESGPP